MANAIEGGSAETKGTMPQSGGIFNMLVGTGLGLLTASANDARQRRMNRNLIAEQVKANKELSRFNQGLALDMWEKTGYEAQRKQMEKAGINPGLMYGGAGSGGTTSTPTGGMPAGGAPMASGQELGMGITTALHAAQLKAQIQNTEASTRNIEADTASKQKDPAKIEAETGLTIQKTQNEAVNNAILKYQEEITQIERNIKSNTEQDLIKSIRQANDKAAEEIRSARASADVQEATKGDIIEQLKMQTKIQAVRLQAEKAGLIKTGAETEQIQANIKTLLQKLELDKEENARAWSKLSIDRQEMFIKKAMQELGAQQTQFNTSEAAQLRQWSQIITDAISAGM